MAGSRFLVVGLAVAALALGVCGRGYATPPAGQAQPAGKVVVEPADNATDVAPAARLRVSVTDGVLGDIRLTESGGRRLKGKLSEDMRSWTATEKPDFDKDYSYSGTATDATGSPLTVSGTFRTAKPRVQVTVSPRVDEGGTYGVAQPVWLVFPAGGIKQKYRPGIERSVSVESEPKTEGAWAWIDAENLVWRPKEYWKPGTKVTIRSSLRGVHFGNDAYGRNDFTRNITIGRHQLVRAETDSYRLIVERDGKRIRNYPASYGLDSDPDLVTRSGRYFIMSKHEMYYMRRFDFEAFWSLRLSNHGEFIHANPGTEGHQGRRNVSHGCANLSMADAEDYFHIALVGDPVLVTGSLIELPAKGADFWAYPWDTWRSLSSLKG
ncbi:L,D-transpeptidase [Allokutzneria oryzae]|uniref:Ig-like domain-containing protein n=1 Tax=Allokutzneria oryzae TaxID=1378989 RepID=A0ABV6A5W8_9PSEU